MHLHYKTQDALGRPSGWRLQFLINWLFYQGMVGKQDVNMFFFSNMYFFAFGEC